MLSRLSIKKLSKKLIQKGSKKSDGLHGSCGTYYDKEENNDDKKIMMLNDDSF